MNLRLLGTYYLLEEKIQRKGIATSLPRLMATIAPEDQAQIQQYVDTIAAILIRTAPPERLSTLEGIEQSLRQQIHVSHFPKLAIHLLKHQISKQKTYPSTQVQPTAESEYLVS